MGLDLKGKELGKGLSQRKNGIYQARYVDRHGRRVTLYDRNLYRLKEDLKAAEEGIKEEKQLFKNSNKKGMTLDKWFKTWMDVYKYGKLRESTRLHYILIYQKRIAPVLGRKQLTDISHASIQKLINNLDKDGVERSGWTGW